jgi:hypothetical protein
VYFHDFFQDFCHVSYHISINMIYAEVGGGAFFALFRFCAHEREAKKRARKREEKKREFAKAPSAKEKSANSRFLLPHNGNPVSEPKVEDRQKRTGKADQAVQDT